MKSARFGRAVLVGAALCAWAGGAAPLRAAVALQSGAEGSVQNWRPEEGAVLVGGHGRVWWTAEGAAWVLSPAGAWSRHARMDLPVPVAEVRLLTDAVLLTVDGDVWHIVDEHWVHADRFPG